MASPSKRAYPLRVRPEVLDAVDRVTNLKVERRIEDRRAGDAPSLVSDNARIKATLPWVPQYAELDTIVRHALQWERQLEDIRPRA